MLERIDKDLHDSPSRFPFQEIEHTHKEAVSIGHAVTIKKVRECGGRETCDPPLDYRSCLVLASRQVPDVRHVS